MQSKLKMVIEYLNPAVQYVLMCDFCCFFHLLSPLVSLFSDCYGGWQMWPVAIFVGTIYFKTYLSRPVYVCKLPVVNPSSDPCQPSSHLTLSGNDSKEQPPTVTFLLHSSPQPSDVFGCGYHLPVSQSHVVSSGDLMSQIGELLTSGTEQDMYSAVEACTATCGAHSKD